MQKSQGAGDGAVLIVDDTIQMPFVGMRDEMAGSGEMAVSPGAQPRPTQPGRTCDQAGGVQLELHKESFVDLKARIAEGFRVRSVRTQQQLRFDAVYAGRMLQQ